MATVETRQILGVGGGIFTGNFTGTVCCLQLFTVRLRPVPRESLPTSHFTRLPPHRSGRRRETSADSLLRLPSVHSMPIVVVTEMSHLAFSKRGSNGVRGSSLFSLGFKNPCDLRPSDSAFEETGRSMCTYAC